MSGGSCRDLRRYINDPKTKQIFMKILTGKECVVVPPEPPKCKNCKATLTGEEKFCPECGSKISDQMEEEKQEVTFTTEELEQKFKSGELQEHKVLEYLRDSCKLPDAIAFELVNKWHKDIQPEEKGVDLNQFKG